MSSREAARATTLDRLGQRRGRDRQRLLALGSGKLGEVLGGEGAQVEARAAAADLDVALGLAQLELDRRRRRASGRARRAAGPAAGPSRRPRPRPRASVCRPISRSVARRGSRAALVGRDQDARERLGRGAGGDRAGDDGELGDELVAFGGQLQLINAFLSWFSACGNAEDRADIGTGMGIRGCGRGCGRAWILAVPSAVRPRLPARLWIASRSCSTLLGELRVLADAGFDPAQRVEHGGVVAAAVEAADLRAARGRSSSRVRRIATWRARSGVAARLEPTSSAREMPKAVGDALLDLLDRGRRAGRRGSGDRARRSARELERPRGQRGVGDDPGQGAVQLADVGVDPAGELGRASPSPIVDARPRGPGGAGRSSRVARLGGSTGDRQAPLEAVAQPRRRGSRARSGCGRRRARAGCRPRRGR